MEVTSQRLTIFRGFGGDGDRQVQLRLAVIGHLEVEAAPG